jgi:hypothetical protein
MSGGGRNNVFITFTQADMAIWLKVAESKVWKGKARFPSKPNC